MEIIDIIEADRDYLAGAEAPEVIAAQWAEAGFSPAETLAWTEARCWDADAAAELRDLGVTPEQAGRRYDHAGQNNTLGYWAANGDLRDMQWAYGDVAGYLGVTTATVRKYVSEGRLPDPDGRLANSPWWRAERIIAWHAQRPGRGGRPRRG